MVVNLLMGLLLLRFYVCVYTAPLFSCLKCSLYSFSRVFLFSGVFFLLLLLSIQMY